MEEVSVHFVEDMASLDDWSANVNSPINTNVKFPARLFDEDALGVLASQLIHATPLEFGNIVFEVDKTAFKGIGL